MHEVFSTVHLTS